MARLRRRRSSLKRSFLLLLAGVASLAALAFARRAETQVPAGPPGPRERAVLARRLSAPPETTGALPVPPRHIRLPTAAIGDAPLPTRRLEFPAAPGGGLFHPGGALLEAGPTTGTAGLSASFTGLSTTDDAAEPEYAPVDGLPADGQSAETTPAESDRVGPLGSDEPATEGSPQFEARAPERPLESASLRQHTVIDGDTLTGLAARYLGSSDRYRDIFTANRRVLTNPDLLPIGAVLQIPASAARPGSGKTASY